MYIINDINKVASPVKKNTCVKNVKQSFIDCLKLFYITKCGNAFHYRYDCLASSLGRLRELMKNLVVMEGGIANSVDNDEN